MIVKSDSRQEQDMIDDLVLQDVELKKQHEIFLAEMEFKQLLIQTRKEKNMTQQQVSEKSGLSQQAVSRVEKGSGGTLDTVMRYLNSLGCTLSVQRIGK